MYLYGSRGVPSHSSVQGSRGVPSHSSVQGSRGVPSHSSGHGPGAFRVILPSLPNPSKIEARNKKKI